MKKLYSLLLTLALAGPLAAQTVPETQLPLLTKVTASWCINCGTWGWDLFEGLIEDNTDQAVLVAAHYSGSLVSTISQDWAANFGATGQPQFFLDEERQSASSGSVMTARAAIAQKVNQASQNSPLAQTGINAEYGYEQNGQLITIETKTKFFADATGDFYLGVYLLEKSYFGSQTGQGGNAEHKFVMRRSLSGNSFGASLGNTSFTAGQEISTSGTLTLTAGQTPDDFQVATVIWRKVGNTYQVVNSNFTNEINLTTRVVTENFPGLQVQVGPNPSAGPSRIDLQLERPANHLEIFLQSADGRTVTLAHRGALPAGGHTFQIERPAGAGIYFLMIRDGDRRMTRRVVFQ